MVISFRIPRRGSFRAIAVVLSGAWAVISAVPLLAQSIEFDWAWHALSFYALRLYGVAFLCLLVARVSLRAKSMSWLRRWLLLVVGIGILDVATWESYLYVGVVPVKTFVMTSVVYLGLVAFFPEMTLGRIPMRFSRRLPVLRAAGLCGLLAAAIYMGRHDNYDLENAALSLRHCVSPPPSSVSSAPAAFQATTDWRYWRGLARDSQGVDRGQLADAVRREGDIGQKARLLWLGSVLYLGDHEDELAACLTSEFVSLRIVAVQMLGLYRFDRYRDAITRATLDSDRMVALAAYEILQMMSGDIEERNEYATRRAALLSRENVFVRVSADRRPLMSHDVRIRLSAENLGAMHRQIPLPRSRISDGLPNFQDVKCLYSIDGAPYAQGKIRLRGMMPVHYRFAEKSYKLILSKTDPTGWRSLNLNVLASDSELQDMMAAAFYGRFGRIPYYRTGYCRLFINGRYDGLRHTVENHDEAFLAEWNLPPGNIYREEDFVDFNRYNWDDTTYFAAKWKNKVTNADISLVDVVNAHRVLNTVPDEHFLEYARIVFDGEEIMNWYAVTIVIGGMHQNMSHNVLWYTNARTGRISRYPIDVFLFDFARSVNLIPDLLFKRLLENREWNLEKNRRVLSLLKRVENDSFLVGQYRLNLDGFHTALEDAEKRRDGYLSIFLRPTGEIVSEYEKNVRAHAAYIADALCIAPHVALEHDEEWLKLRIWSEAACEIIEVATVPEGRVLDFRFSYQPRLVPERVWNTQATYSMQAMKVLPQSVILPNVVTEDMRALRVTARNLVTDRTEIFTVRVPAD